GHSCFFLAGHDRGGRVAYRLTLDNPERVTRLAALDIVPTFEVWTAMDWKGALGGFHWPFLAQPAPLPERMIGADPDLFIGHLIERWAGDPAKLKPDAMAAYLKQFHKPEVIAATCADYRAGATVDMDHDRADRAAGRKIGCPVLLVWGRRYLTAKAGSPLASWREWADDVREVPLDCGHFVAEEEPDACAAALIDFFGDD
ncbi:MAG: alpha/beta hydrolase, partial [Minwuiales bacterium]|nr:alpha/beta hydrolase [Minwuiales bacterium]